ncbi:MAG: hypothetical protein M5T61_02590 [Acidimicrobiia bacterium]|nr:hypothetical protein [Acidimicrobiia bacterium]
MSRRPAKTRMYASTIHWSSLFDAPSSVTRRGIAVLRIVASRLVISSEKQRTDSVHHRIR